MRFSVLCFQGILGEEHACLGQRQALETPLQRSQPDLQSLGGYHSGGALLLLDGCVAQAGREGGRGVESTAQRGPVCIGNVAAQPFPGWMTA